MPNLVRQLEVKLDEYRKNSVPPLYTPGMTYDPNSNPKNWGDKYYPGWC